MVSHSESYSLCCNVWGLNTSNIATSANKNEDIYKLEFGVSENTHTYKHTHMRAREFV